MLRRSVLVEPAASLEHCIVMERSRIGRGAQVRISHDQLLAWDPEIVIAADRRFYNALRRDRAMAVIPIVVCSADDRFLEPHAYQLQKFRSAGF